jgi:peptidyl-prolyl cis-trans isomerase SurA
MKNLFLLIFIISFLLFSPESFSEVVDRIIAIVNDDIITLKEVEQFVHVEKNRFKSVEDYLVGLKLREKLGILIENTLIKQQAKKMKIDVSDREVREVVENIKKQHLITEEELKEQLKKENLSYDEFLKGIRITLLRNKVLARVITPEVNLTEKALKDYYDSHFDEFTEEELHLQQIFISGLREDSKERADFVYDSLSKGIPFEELAKQYSDDPSGKYGGDVGYVKKEELIPEIREAIKDLREGSYARTIQSRYGFHILKLVNRKKGDIIPFEKAKEEIKRRLIMEESEKRYKDFIDKLKRSSYIEVKL